MAINAQIQNLNFEESEESKQGSNTQPEKSDMQKVLESLSTKENTNISLQNIETPTTPYPTQPVKEEQEDTFFNEEEELFSKKYLADNYSPQFRASHSLTPSIDDSWQHVSLPSRGIFYDKDEVMVRPLKTRHLCKIQGAVESQAISGILNTLDSCIDMDIRDLTQPDFRFLMYWWRLHSFPKTPLQLRWVSKYGNENISTIVETNLSVAVTTETRERVQQFREKGITYPTVRELEYSILNKLNTEDAWLFNYAQYYIGNSVDEKVERLDNNSSNFKSDITEFTKVFEHGIDEVVYARDIHFDKAKYIELLNQRINYLRDRVADLEIKYADKIGEKYQIEIEATYEAIGTLENQLMEAQLLQQAEEEKIEIPFRMVNLLPDVQLTADSE